MSIARMFLVVLACAASACTTSAGPQGEGEGEGDPSAEGEEGEGEAGEGEGEAGEGEGGEGEGEGGEGEGEQGGEGEGEGDHAGRIPPALPTYSHGTCPTLVGGATSASSVVTGFATGDQVRSFRLLVPASYDGTQRYALMFAWHWLNASSSSFVDQGELESAIEEYPFIIVLPDKRLNANGSKAYQFDWPFAETWGTESELVFFDDLLACVNEQFSVDRDRVYGIGVSAGALWVSYLSTTARANHLAAVESLSGGLGSLGFGGAGWQMEYAPQPNKFPAIVLWGGDSDWLGLSFRDASVAYRDALRADAHFVVECVHDAGHAVPPIDPPPGQTRFSFLWEFMLDHPMGVAGGASPWRNAGMPSFAPSWCSLPP
ncbi:MAG: hypothetical protein IT383_06685 [Deltaproteobacteria bacterium]|nr:hypothetical protein [Deltaproteobacteria bacterium]